MSRNTIPHLFLWAFLFSGVVAPTIAEAGTIHYKSESRTASASNCVNDASFGTRTWTTPENASSSDNVYATVVVDGTVSNYIKCTNYGFAIPQAAVIKEIQVSMERSSNSTGNGGSQDAAVRIVKGGGVGSVDFSSATTYTTADVDENHASSSVPLWGLAWSPSDINASNFGAAVAVTKANAAGPAHTVSIDQIKITVYYSLFPMIATQQGSIFENDDHASNVDGRTAQAAASTSITSVAQGERVNARFHLRMASSSATTTLGLFWDKNDGVWTKVSMNAPAATTSIGTCLDTSWNCSAIITTTNVSATKIMSAIDPSGSLWVVLTNSASGDIVVARYVGSGGTGCDSAEWTCVTVDSAANVGGDLDLKFDLSGSPWITYKNIDTTALRVARYVGAGGTGCTTTEWTCVDVYAANNSGNYTSLSIDGQNRTWVAFHDNTLFDFLVARYVGSGGTGCDTAEWTCVTVVGTTSAGWYTAGATDGDGNPWFSFQKGSPAGLQVARYVGSGGTGCDTAEWSCTIIDSANSAGYYSSIAFDPSGIPWITYYAQTSGNLRLARYVGSGGTGCDNPAWTCSDLVASADYSSLAFDAAGIPWVAYRKTSVADFHVARYVGSGGTGCATAEWTCTVMETSLNTGVYPSLTFDALGYPWIPFLETSSADLRIARLNPRGTPFVPAASLAQGVASTTRASHTDMTSVSDTTNRNDADCVKSGGTWINGISAGGEEITLAPWSTSGSGELCTEVNFTLDTTLAATSTTYRLVVSMKDGWRSDVGIWRGLATTTQPTVHASTTIVSSGTTIRSLKGSSAGFGTCAHASWSCQAVKTGSFDGYYSDIEFDAQGNPWIPYSNVISGNLNIARYVGTGGTGCDTSSWACEVIDSSTSNVGQQPSLAFDPSGTPWMAYPDSVNGDLKVARYVGTGGTGCAVSTWTCESIDTANDVGADPDIAFDAFGNPWIAYKDTTNTDLRIAYYTGSAGTGCAISTWTCTTIHATSTASVGAYPSLAFDSLGRPWVSYHDLTSLDLLIARYVGAGGTGCSVSTWTCEILDSTGNVGVSNALAFDRSGRAWISSLLSTSNDLRIARYVGSGGTGCAISSWTCTTIVTTASVGSHTSLAIDAEDRPWVPYYDSGPNDLAVARYVGSGGTGCDDSAWTCVTVDDPNTTGEHNSIAFDPQGVPWVAYRNGTSEQLRVAKLVPSTPRYFATTSPRLSDSSYRLGRAFVLGSGKSPRTDADGTCNAAGDHHGYCGIALDDSAADGITVYPGDRSLYAFESFSDLSATPTLTWIGRSTTAPSARNIFAEIYRAGTTNNWVVLPLTTDTCSTAATDTDCTIVGAPTAGAHSEYHYFDAISGGYRTQFRITQIAPTYATTTLKTDYVNVTFPSTLTQDHYRWRGDDGDEAGAQFIADQDTALSNAAHVGDRIRLRILVSNNSASAATNKLYRLDYSSSSCTTYLPLGEMNDSTSEWVSDLSQWIPDGAASTNLAGLTDPGGKTFTAGEIRAGNRKTNAHSLTPSQFTELEYVLRSTLLATPGITYCFRVSDDGDSSNLQYSYIAQLILRAGPRAQTGGGGAGGEGHGSGNQLQGGGSGGGSDAGGEGSGSGGSQQGGGASGGGDSG